MAYVIADNIISPLGMTSEDNYLSVKAGKSMLHAYAPGTKGIPESFAASLFSDETSFEKLAFASARKALEQADIDMSKHRVMLILSSTKGAIEQLDKAEDEDVLLGASASRIARGLGIPTQPIVICNACISGLSALILGARLLDADAYDYVVVCGCDCPGRFVISGFQSLKALSTEPCRPFDMERFGLNLGEAAATIVLGRQKPRGGQESASHSDIWQVGEGYVRNDAFHISAPSKTSEGLYLCLQQTLQGVHSDELAFINAHGTATLFNDQMESIAIQRAGLSDVPVNALKCYFGHTLGAAGILETILSMKAVDDHIIIGTRGFEELGVSGKIHVSAENQSTEKVSFVKMLSGFGGCNATMLITKGKQLCSGFSVVESHGDKSSCGLKKTHHILLTPERRELDGITLDIDDSSCDASSLTDIYKQKIGNYPKYYKMDGLSRLGFVASELLLQAEASANVEMPDDSRAVILFNRTSSIQSDKKYLESIADADHFFPSPSIFVYTLPNIVTGEIAIRNGYHGETSFYVLAEKNEQLMEEVLMTAWQDAHTKSAITGWIDFEDDTHFEADLYIVEYHV